MKRGGSWTQRHSINSKWQGKWVRATTYCTCLLISVWCFMCENEGTKGWKLLMWLPSSPVRHSVYNSAWNAAWTRCVYVCTCCSHPLERRWPARRCRRVYLRHCRWRDSDRPAHSEPQDKGLWSMWNAQMPRGWLHYKQILHHKREQVFYIHINTYIVYSNIHISTFPDTSACCVWDYSIHTSSVEFSLREK